MHLWQVLQLGTIDYGTALDLQQTLVDLRKQGRIADTLLLLEHPPVITLGRNSKSVNIVASPEFLAEKGVEVFEINRGGDVTFHGPGQLVGYPIVDLRGYSPKLGAVDFVRKLEESLIRTCAEFSIAAQRVAGMTGVWTEAAEERKIAAIGIHISRGVTSHGFALNVTTDLDFFKLIVPCGITDKPVTSMEQEIGGLVAESGKRIEMNTVSEVFTRQFGNVFGTQILWLESLESLFSVGSDGRPANQDTPLRPPDDLQQLESELRGRDDISFSA
jgi:lipoyl(octanoyl) transferase